MPLRFLPFIQVFFRIKTSTHKSTQLLKSLKPLRSKALAFRHSCMVFLDWMMAPLELTPTLNSHFFLKPRHFRSFRISGRCTSQPAKSSQAGVLWFLTTRTLFVTKGDSGRESFGICTQERYCLVKQTLFPLSGLFWDDGGASLKAP